MKYIQQSGMRYAQHSTEVEAFHFTREIIPSNLVKWLQSNWPEIDVSIYYNDSDEGWELYLFIEDKSYILNEGDYFVKYNSDFVTVVPKSYFEEHYTFLPDYTILVSEDCYKIGGEK